MATVGNAKASGADARSKGGLRASSIGAKGKDPRGSGASSSSLSDGDASTRLVPRKVETPSGPGGPPALAASGRPQGSRLLDDPPKSSTIVDSSSADGHATGSGGSHAASKARRAGDMPAGGGGGGDGAAAAGGGGGGGGSSAGGADSKKAGAGPGPSGATGLRIPLGGSSKRVASTVASIPSSFSSIRAASGAEAMNAAHRSTMEDAFVVIDKFGGDDGTGLFAVYDGHGGRFVAEYLRTHLHDNIERELLAKADRSVEECLKSAFVVTDIECSRTGESASGATAILCIVRRQGPKRYVYTANCGDARAVLCHDGRAVRLSMDHKATDEPEVRRIESAGGFVVRKRVMGVLAVARAFGDFAFKKYVTPEPFTSTTKLNASSQFLVIACDGVWDVMDD